MKNEIKKLGIVGANVSAAFICMEAAKRGIETYVLAPTTYTTATPFATTEIIGEFTAENINRLAHRVDALIFCTTEIPVSLESIETNIPTYPSKEGIQLIGDRIYQLNLAQSLEIPIPKFNHYTKGQESMEILQDIDIPFTFYEKGKDYCHVTDVMTEKEVAHFANHLKPDATEWLSEQLSKYTSILTITLLQDTKGKQVVYEVTEEQNTDWGLQINVPAVVSKALKQKVTRYAKKLLKAIKTEGIFSVEFGIKENKEVEMIDVTPGIGIGDIATCHCYEYSTYEQFLNLVMGYPLQNMELAKEGAVYFAKEKQEDIAFPYHFYEMDRHLQDPMYIYIQCKQN
jgi:phosphoribosylaminoimidazole carboxylase (NCAIR synthetase)